MQYILGIDLGGTNVKAVAFALADGRECFRQTAPTRDGQSVDGVPAWAAAVRSLVAACANQLGGPPARIGLAAPGLAALDERSIAFMPGRLQGLEGWDWTNFLATPAPVPVLNDAGAALLGEVWQGAARGLRDVFMVTLGTGVGGAVLSDGRLLRGKIGRAGHLGHISLDPHGAPDITRIPGSLEDKIGECTVQARSGGRFASTHALVQAYERGDTEAARLWLESVRALGCAIASLVNVCDPEAVVIGGGIAQAGTALFTPLAAVLDEVEWRPAGHRVRIVPAQLGDWAGAYGAAYRAQQTISP
ncbi:MAG: ROK family protein [Opitutae bacterium]|nr:ROK family protein [Opitutae bacterium]